MAGIQFKNFIDNYTERTWKGGNYRDGDTITSTVEGFSFYDMKSYIPIIVNGLGCVGYAKITSIEYVIRSNNEYTVLTYDVHKVSEKTAEAAYIIYKNQKGVGGDGDDTVIPGVYRAKSSSIDTPRTYRASSSSYTASEDSDLPNFLRRK